MNSSKRSRRVLIGISAAVVLPAAIFVALAAAKGSPPPNASSGQQREAASAPVRSASAAGLDVRLAKPVFRLHSGQQVSLVTDSQVGCLIRSGSGQRAEMCATSGEIEEGRAVSVLDECGTGGHDRMEILGLAPPGVTGALLHWSDTHTETDGVTEGAFEFQGTNPTAAEPYPTGIVWLAGEQRDGEAIFPVSGNRFCLPAE